MNSDQSALPKAVDETFVGTVVATEVGHSLVTSLRGFRLAADHKALEPFVQQRVVLRGRIDHTGVLHVQGIWEMLSDKKIKECAQFVIGKHGQRASAHAIGRLNEALKRGDLAQIEIWKVICRLTIT